jgi:hypothetical protein
MLKEVVSSETGQHVTFHPAGALGRDRRPFGFS